MQKLNSIPLNLLKLLPAATRVVFICFSFLAVINTNAQCYKDFKYAMGTTGADAAYDIVNAGNGDFFVIGTTLENGTGKNVLVTKMNSGGSVYWSKAYGGLGTEVVKKASKTRDNGLLITGSTGSFGNAKGDIMCMRLDNDGDIVWNRYFGLNSANGDVGMDITETSEGGYAVAGITNASGAAADIVVIRLDADANVIWSKRFDRGQGEEGVGITENGSSLMVTADIQNSGANDESIIMELDKATGSMLKAVKLHPETGGFNNPYISKDAVNGGYWISGHLTDRAQPSKMQQVVLKLNADLTISRSYKLAMPEYANNNFSGFESMNNGGFIACSGMESSSSGFLFSIRNDGNIGFAKKLVGGRDRRLNRLQLIGNKIIAVGSDNRKGNDEMFIIAFDSGGVVESPCQTDTADLTVQTQAFTSSAFSWPTISNIAFSNINAVFDARPIDLIIDVLCSIDCVVQDTTSVTCGNTWLNVLASKSGVTAGDLDITGNKITIEANINRTQPYDNSFYGGDIISKHCDPTDVNYLLRANRAEITTTNGFFATPDVCNIELNKTYHVAMVYNGSSLKYYRNGYLMSEVSCSGNLILNNYPTTFGTTACPSNPHPSEFLGEINEVRIWNVERTQDELKSYMDKSLPTPTTQTGLQAYYTFDDLNNEQGNASWNGQVLQNASLKQANPTCISFIADSCAIVITPTPVVKAGFTIPDTVCVNTPVLINNTTTGATNFYWNFNVADINSTPEGTNLGNIDGQFALPVFTDQVYVNGNYYVFVVNNYPGGLVRLDFGNNMLNTPVSVNLGAVGGIIPNNAEGIQVVQNNGNWYALIVGGYPPSGVPSRIIKIEFGADITNTSPVGTNWGNIGNLNYPIDLHVFQENNNWYGFTVNSGNNTITRFNFGFGFDNPPSAVNLGNLGNLDLPTGIYAINNQGSWNVFITNGSDNSSITRLDFGNSLLNTPFATNLGNPGNTLFRPRDIYIVKFCGELVGFIVNGLQTHNDLVKLNFNGSLLNQPSAISLGNQGNLDFPHSLSKMFRVGADLYSFITNVSNNTLTRLRFAGSTNSSIPNSSDSIPPSVTYNTPGVYNINMMVDEGLPTQTSVCKAVVVKDCFVQNTIEPDFEIPDTVCVNTPVTIKNNTTGGTNFYWNFCESNLSTPEASNLGNPDAKLQAPVFMDIASENGNYFGFVINNYPGGLVRLDFGNSILNNPVATNLGNFGGVVPNTAEGIQLINTNGKWQAIIVGGTILSGGTPKIIKIDFGSSLTNSNPIATDWGNIGNLDEPIDLFVFKDKNIWYGFTVNSSNNTVTRFNFGPNFENPPTAINLGDFGTLNYPTGIYAVSEDNYWRVFITNAHSNSIVRLDFGTSLLNNPSVTNVGNPSNTMNLPRDISIMKLCNEYVGFVVNQGSNDIVKLNFVNGLGGQPNALSLGNIGELSVPHSISQLFRVNSDLYSFITNVTNNTITRLQFSGCTNSSIPNSSDSIPPAVTYNTPGVYNINMMVDEGLPTQTSVCKAVVVVAAPVKTPLFDTAFCAGDSLLLKATFAGGTYTWSNGNTDSAITINQPGTYWVQTDYYGCSVRDSINTYKNILPVIDLGADSSICNADSIFLNAGNPGAKYLWQDGSTKQIYNATDSGTYSVKVTDINGCINIDSVKINFYGSIQLQLTADTTICKGSNLTLSASGNNVQTWSWSPAATLSNPSVNNPVATPLDTTLYALDITDISGCKVRDSVWVNVAPQPAIAILGDSAICAGESTQLSTNATNTLKYTWSPSTGLSDKNSAAPVATPVSTTRYIVTATAQAGCAAKDSIDIIVNSLPALAAGTLDTLICIGSSTTIAATSPTAVSYIWSPSAGLNDASSPTPVATPASTTNYYVEAKDINGCKAIDSVFISVKSKPVFAVNPPSAGICTGETVTLTASGGDEYAWYPPNTLSDPNSAVTTATPVFTTTYKAVITDNICAITDSVFTTVNINSLSTVDVTKSNDVDCIIGTTLLRATGGVTYKWYPATYLSDSTIANPVAAPLATTTYYAQVTNAAGCSGIDSVTVYVFKGSVENGYKLPSAFTPNNDGFNDCFGVRKWGTLGSLDLSIYNRWGNLVFHSNNASDCWDGTYKGQLQPPGAYVYQIRAQALCGTVYRKGTVVLVR